jgi:hypothetical protein
LEFEQIFKDFIFGKQKLSNVVARLKDKWISIQTDTNLMHNI